MADRSEYLQFSEKERQNSSPKNSVKKTESRLHFNKQRSPSAIRFADCNTPIHALSSQFHREMREADDNSATSATDMTVSVAEGINYKGNQASKYQQKKAIKQEYAKSKRTSPETAKTSEIAAKTFEKTKQTIEFVRKNKKYLLILGVIAMILLILMGMISSCSVLLQGTVGSLGMTTYTADEEDIRNTEAVYSDLEDDLREKLENYEDYYLDYDEYNIMGEVLGHDPFVLASILSAVYGEYTSDDAEDLLTIIFDMQYELTEEVIHIDNTSVCFVTLTCTDMEDIAEAILSQEEYERYEVFMTTSGNLPELFD